MMPLMDRFTFLAGLWVALLGFATLGIGLFLTQRCKIAFE